MIHCLGPVYGLDEPSSDLLASCYRCALEVAEHHLMESVVFPAISTGAFGYPVQDAARVAIGAVASPATQTLHHVRVEYGDPRRGRERRYMHQTQDRYGTADAPVIVLSGAPTHGLGKAPIGTRDTRALSNYVSPLTALR